MEAELTNLCFREYGTFISVYQCSAAVQSAFDDFEGSLGQLLDSVPALEEECRAFGKGTQGIQAVRSRAALVQEHQDKLSDLLELPQLLETCVRNGYYQEAMELAGHAARLKEEIHLPLVQDVGKEVEAVVQLMLAQLLGLLREPVKLPILIKAVTFLRRLGGSNEEELGLVFLSGRLFNFHAQLGSLEHDKAEPVRYLRRYIDLFREHIYDIISQYTAIFADTTQLTSFASLCVTDLVQLVKVYVPRVLDPASMSSILVQLGYCAISFARVGLDFTTLIGKPFSDAVRDSYSQTVMVATTALATTLRNATKGAASPFDVLVAQDYQTRMPLDFGNDITHFPPLAVFTNAHLSALNALRLLAPIHLYATLVALQSASLVASTTVVLQYMQQATALPEVNGDRPKHQRTPSSPRAHLLRRNTETLLAPEIRAARRRQAQQACVDFAKAWRTAMDLIVKGLTNGIYERDMRYEKELERKLGELADWALQNVPREHRGVIAEETVRPKVLFPANPINGKSEDHEAASGTSPPMIIGSISPRAASARSNDGPPLAILENLQDPARLADSIKQRDDEAPTSETGDLEGGIAASSLDKMSAPPNHESKHDVHQGLPLPTNVASQLITDRPADLDAVDLGLMGELVGVQTMGGEPSQMIEPAAEENGMGTGNDLEAKVTGGSEGKHPELNHVQAEETRGGILDAARDAVESGMGAETPVEDDGSTVGASKPDVVEGEIRANMDHTTVREIETDVSGGDAREGIDEGKDAVDSIQAEGDGTADEGEEEVENISEKAMEDDSPEGSTPRSPSQADPVQPKAKRKKKKGKR